MPGQDRGVEIVHIVLMMRLVVLADHRGRGPQVHRIALVRFRLNPPANHPQVTPAVLSRSPMFFPPISALNRVGDEHTSSSGSASLTSVSPPFPSPTTSELGPFADAITPFVRPEIRLIAPGVDGPKFVFYELSFNAKCCA